MTKLDSRICLALGLVLVLPDHYRAVIVLHDVEGLSMTEVADCLDIGVNTAKARAHRARLVLRQRLARFMSGAASGVEMGS